MDEDLSDIWSPDERRFIGAMKATINDHGPITRELIPSVMKRYRGNQAKPTSPEPSVPFKLG